MKLKFSLGLVLCMFAGCTDNISKSLNESTNSSKTGVTKTATKPLAVSDAQVISMRGIMDKIINGKLSGPEELFKIINGQTQTTDRELPVPGAVTEAVEKGLRIVCYQEGRETVVASTDPTLLGKSASDFKTDDGKVVRDVAIEELRKSKNDEAIFTYVVQSKGDEPMVNGKPITHGRVVVAKGRNAFKNFTSEKKFLCTVGAKINAAG